MGILQAEIWKRKGSQIGRELSGDTKIKAWNDSCGRCDTDGIRVSPRGKRIDQFYVVPFFLAMEDLQTSMPLSLSSVTGTFTLMSRISIDLELWLEAEERTQEILYAIQPVMVSEMKRETIIKYVKDLFKEHFGAEVFAYGSVPLRTYLPDGDIDLTALIHPNMEENFARDVCKILKSEEERGFQVKNINYIQAQVKVVKCCVKNISVDISFNQMAGLTTMHFLQQVDQFIGKDHLLKRSIILVKAWCYYESRILGAHRGLLSTYALEILVLHIINRFNASLPGPLAVLYRFLEYYSRFDWETYAVGIFGRVPLSSLHGFTAYSTESTEQNGFLIGQDLLRNIGSSSSSRRHAEDGTNGFLIKYLNIVDPLKDGNNLGRSVSLGNFRRIKRALREGVQELSEILQLPGESMVAGLEKFFVNTVERNGRGLRPDAEVPVPAFGSGRSVPLSLRAEYNSHVSDMQHFQSLHPPQLDLSLLPRIVSQAVPLLHSNNILYPRYNPAAFAPHVHARGGLYVPIMQNGANGFVSLVPFGQPYPYQLYVGILPRSRGTGAYIPTLAAYLYGNDRQSSRRRAAPSPRTRSHWPPRIDAIDVPPQEQESGNNISISEPENQAARDTEKSGLDEEKSAEGNSFDLSLEQFPHLPSINKAMSAEADEPCEPIPDATESNDVIPAKGIKFGALQPGNITDATASPDIANRIVAEEFQMRNDEFPPLQS